MAASLAPLVLSGCASDFELDHTGEDAPRALPLQRPVRMAWVFSSGGPRGFVHIGVLKALEQLGLQPDLLVGASIGSLVAVLFAAGRSASEIEALALDFNPVNVARLALGAEETFSGRPLAELVRDQIEQSVNRPRPQPTNQPFAQPPTSHGFTQPQALAAQSQHTPAAGSAGTLARHSHAGKPLLQHLPLPAVCVVQRLPAGAAAGTQDSHGSRAIGFSHGDAGLAVQASCAVPGIFTPVRIRGQLYADADLHLPLPVRLARSLGAEKVLAVDASAHESTAPASAQRYREGDLRKRALIEPDAAAADLLLHPDFGYYVSLTREFRERAIATGYRDTLARADVLVRLHQG